MESHMLFQRGDVVELLPEHRDDGDEQFTWVVVADEEKGRVDISPVNIDMDVKPVHTVQVGWIRHKPSKV